MTRHSFSLKNDKHSIKKLYTILILTRNHGLTRRASTHCRGIDGIKSRFNTASKLRTLKMVPTALMLFRCSTLIIRVGEMPWTKTRNSLPCTVRTSRQRSCKQRVGCLLHRCYITKYTWRLSMLHYN